MLPIKPCCHRSYISSDLFQCSSPKIFISSENRMIPREVCDNCVVVNHGCPPSHVMFGPGSLLHSIIHRITGEQPTTLVEKVDPNDPKPPCQCQSRMQQMDVWGWKGCWEHRDEICGWLAENAKRLGYDVEPNLPALTRLALKTAKERKATIDAEMMERFGKLVDENGEAAEVFRLLIAELEPLIPEAMWLFAA